MALAPAATLANGFEYPLPARLGSQDFVAFRPEQVKLGQLLFYDKILSGNRNISCGTCHHPKFGGGDGLSLGIGEGGQGLGPDRTPGMGEHRIKKRIPRNAPSLWNLGARQVSVMFHDGRLTESDIYENGFNSPAQEWLPKGLSSLLAAQALLPMTSQFEMAGNPKENQVAGAAHDRIDRVWPILAKRIRGIDGYKQRFIDAFDHIDSAQDVTIVDVAEALAAFISTEWQSFDSPFDQYLTGKDNALNDQQKKGLELFFGRANCARCHNGPLLSDQQFYGIALPPFGPGRTRLFDPAARDVGFMGTSDRLEDAYRFRTPSLRNVSLTGPYGHNGAYASLEGIIRHHLSPQKSFDRWRKHQAKLIPIPWLADIDFVVWENQRDIQAVRDKVDIEPIDLNDDEVAQLVALMDAFTGSSATTLPLGVPETVPSGLDVTD